ncbi:hypothetical protein [Actinoplanes sp. GCM10030250]|uniref:hypothetical protein n=1 Tax=Actinoplanes sp. GCM10030250 TaxID=3273376 RepID=UPI003610A714
MRESKERAAKPKRRAGNVLAVVLSVLALVVSAAAGFLSWRAMEAARAAHEQTAQALAGGGNATRNQAGNRNGNQAGSQAGNGTGNQAGSQAGSQAGNGTGNQAGNSNGNQAANRPPEPEEYPVSYAKEPLRVQVGCSAVLFLDLDEPRADAEEQAADLRYDSRCGDEPPRLSLGAGAAAGSQRTGADLDAAGCLRAIRTSPLGPGADVEVKKGTALCVLTSGNPAELVLVEIIDVGGTGTAGLRATSWQVPR